MIKRHTYLAFFLFYVLLVLFNSGNSFFWDTLLQGSKYAHWYFENNFHQLFLPAELDAGHPPFFAIYLALVWKLFGKTLIISHLAMLPFVLGIVWQVYKIAKQFFEENQLGWVLLIVLTDATFMAQSTLVSPDLVLTFGFLLALNGIIANRKLLIVLGTLCAGLVSIRGLFAIGSLFIMQQLFYWIRTKEVSWKESVLTALPFVPAVVILAGYYLTHFQQTGWLLSTPNEGWTKHRELVGIPGFLRNAGILAWRFLDFGRVAIWLGLLVSLIPFIRKRIPFKRDALFFLLLPVIFVLSYSPGLLLIQNPIGHRYLLPAYLLVALAFAYFAWKSFGEKVWFRFLIIVVVLIQLSGNLWIYPANVAQGWDSTLAHLPYYDLRHKMINYIKERNIPFEEIGTEFPNLGPIKYIDLNENTNAFAPKDVKTQDYIFYSNVYNDFTDEELKRLEEEWEIEQRYEKNRIEVVLYKKQN